MAENPKNSSNQDRNRPGHQGDAHKPQKPAPATTVGNPDRAHQHPNKGTPNPNQDRDRNKRPPDNADKDRVNKGQNRDNDDLEDDNAVTQRTSRMDPDNQQ
jgi:hypothetical protein